MLQKEGCLKKGIMHGTLKGTVILEDQQYAGKIKWPGFKRELLLWSAEDRSRWQRIVHEAAIPQNEDGLRRDIDMTYFFITA